jgi:hypothetical protein
VLLPPRFFRLKLESDPRGGHVDHRRLPQAWDQQRDLCGWKAKFGGLVVSDARRLKQLEDKNAKLKRLLADVMLEAFARYRLL